MVKFLKWLLHLISPFGIDIGRPEVDIRRCCNVLEREIGFSRGKFHCGRQWKGRYQHTRSVGFTKFIFRSLFNVVGNKISTTLSNRRLSWGFKIFSQRSELRRGLQTRVCVDDFNVLRQVDRSIHHVWNKHHWIRRKLSRFRLRMPNPVIAQFLIQSNLANHLLSFYCLWVSNIMLHTFSPQ